MAVDQIRCAACDVVIRFRQGLPDKDWIECPRCGEEVHLLEIPLDDDYVDDVELIEEEEPPRSANRAQERSRPVGRNRPAVDLSKPAESRTGDRATGGRETGTRDAGSRKSGRQRPAERAARSDGNNGRGQSNRRAGRSRAESPENAGSHKGLWIGLGAGAVGVIALVVALVITLGKNDDGNANNQLANNEKPADDGNNNNNNNAPVAPDSGNPKSAAANPQGNQPAPPAKPAAGGQMFGGQPLDDAPPVAVPPGDGNVVPAPGKVNPAALAGGKLKYQWAPGQEYAYNIEITADLGDETDSIRGRSTFTVTNENPQVLLGRENNEPEEGTGSGFVIGADGLLATCAHVVEDATKIEVVLNDKTYLANVVAVDSQKDLAIIRVAAADLPVLSLADSGKVQLAEDVRVVGFPLTDALGESVKITRGSVAGFVDRKSGQSVMQVDASINPGNSGGPLLNGRGQVIGVASAKLTGRVVTNVGFAVRANELRDFAAKNKITVQAGNATAPVLNGPELARRVVPGVALIKVTIGPGNRQQSVLAHNGSVTSIRRPKNGRMIGAIGTPQSKYDRSKIVVDEFGEILHSEDGESLPYVLGPLSQLILEPLSPTGQTSWSREQATVLRRVQKERDNGPFNFRAPGPNFGPRFGPRGPRGPRIRPQLPGNPFGQPEEKVSVYLAEERYEYEVISADATGYVVKKSYELVTTDANGGKPFLQITGGGQFRVDKPNSLVKRINYQLTMTINENGKSVRIPVTVLVERLTPEELATKKADEAKALADARARNEERAKAANSPETLQKHLDVLKEHAGTGEFSKRFIALSNLRRMKPDDHTAAARKEVIDQVKPLLEDGNSSIKNTARGTFFVWAGQAELPELLGILDSDNILERHGAIKKVGELGGKEAATAIVERMKVSADRFAAKRALKEMGAEAEEPALTLFEHPDDAVRRDIYEVLGDIGTAKSRARLTAQLANEDNFSRKVAIERALRAMDRRGIK